MQILAEASGSTGGGGLAEWTATHPDPLTRVKRLQGEIDKSYANTKTDPKYQLFEERFKTQFKRRLAMLPPADGELTSMRWSSVDLDQPATWCSHCAQAMHAGKKLADFPERTGLVGE